MALGAPGGDDATAMQLTSCEGRCSSSAHCAPHHIQGVDSWNCSFYASDVGWFGGLIDGGETSKQDDFAQASFYLLKCGVMWEGSIPGPAQRRQQARKSSIPSGEERWREMLSLAEMKSTEPRRRVISEAAAVEVPTAVPWITSKMLAESMAEMRYSLMEGGICNGKGHHGLSLLQIFFSSESWKGVIPVPCCSLCCAQATLHPQQPKPRDVSLAEDTQAAPLRPIPGSPSARSCWRR